MKDTLSLARKVSETETVSDAAVRYVVLRSQCEQAYMELLMAVESVKNIELAFPNLTEGSLALIRKTS